MKAIEFNRVSKLYRLGVIGTGTISHDLNRWWHRVRGLDDPYLKLGQDNNRADRNKKSDYVWALKDIDFNVEKGDVVGVIGNNGAGKSTLLKLLSRVTTPTTGEIRFKGRIASLLEVGTGFHPEMTGRENIYMNGAIMGMTRQEIKRKFDDIVDFSGVGKYIDTPTKRYSSGMIVRLGFAVSAFLEQEILIVDEVLAVGDAEFQKKAIGKMQNVSKKEGRTVLFVSHNMEAIQNLCNNAILLHQGKVELYDNVDSVVNQYISISSKIEDRKRILIDNSYRKKTGTMNTEFLEIERLSDFDMEINEDLVFKFSLRINDRLRTKMKITGVINNASGRRVGLFFSDYFSTSSKDIIFRIKVVVKNTYLSAGTYYMDFNLTEGDLTSSFSNIDLVYKTVNFNIKYTNKEERKVISTWQPQWGSNCFLDVELLEV